MAHYPPRKEKSKEIIHPPLMIFWHDEGMFWRKKKKNKKNKDQPVKKTDENLDVIAAALNEVDIGDSYAKGSESDKIRARALALTRKARANLGEETIQKMAEMLRKK